MCANRIAGDAGVERSGVASSGCRLSSSVGISSLTVGWMWTASRITLYDASAAITSSSAWTISSPSMQSSDAPRMRSLAASTSTFIKPCVSPRSRALPTRVIGMVATRAGLPRARTSASLKPTRPSGGSMKSA